MALPNNASIAQVAAAFGVSDKMNQLTPAAKKLTKGQMLTLLGMKDESQAVRSIALGTFKRPAPTLVERTAGIAGIKLTAADIQSVETVFGPARLPASERQTIQRAVLVGPTGRGGISGPEELELGNIDIHCCCCPCCCATAVFDPVQPAVA